MHEQGIPVDNRCAAAEQPVREQAKDQCSGGPDRPRVCGEAMRYVTRELTLEPKRAILACEGGCLKGEVARVAANLLAYRLQPDAAVRICLGDAATGDSGMLKLVLRAPEVIAIEGCPLHCGTEILRNRVPNLKTTVVDASRMYSFDRSKFFGIMDMPHSDIEAFAETVAEHVQERFFADPECAGLAPPSGGCGES